MAMVQYWKTKDSCQAKVMKNKDGALVMKLEGEKEIFPGYPRGHLLFGTLSKIKHEIKNQLFNESWHLLDQGIPDQSVIDQFKLKLANIYELVDKARYDMVPPTCMVLPVREIWRAMTTLEKESPHVEPLKKALTYILQEDDAYRFRLQWIVQIFNPSAWWFKLFFRDPIKDWDIALQELEVAEVIDDMKERIRLLRRITLLVLSDKRIKELFLKLCKEIDWNKIKLSRADKYHFRGKYFKVDLDKFEY